MTHEEAARVLNHDINEYESELRIYKLTPSVIKEVNDTIEAMQIACAVLSEPKPGWIPVKPHTNDYSKPEDGTLPLNIEDVLVVWSKQITIGLYAKSCWYYLNQDKMKYEMDAHNQVTHWMPLPKLPE